MTSRNPISEDYPAEADGSKKVWPPKAVFCAGCNEPIKSESLKVEGRHFHPKCLTCCECKEQIFGPYYMLGEDRIGCRDCRVKTAPKCGTCNELVIGPSTIYDGQHHHRRCLKCSSCRQELTEKLYAERDGGKLLCRDCGMKQAPKCAKCGDSVVGQHATVGGRLYHFDCIKCSSCHVSLRGKQYYEKEGGDGGGGFICKGCNEEQNPPPRCGACKEVITGHFVDVGSNRFHTECFVCVQCKAHITGAFAEMPDGPICESCAKKPSNATRS